jgi:hypothetical protein
MTFHPAQPGYDPYWEAPGGNPDALARIRARAITALDFLVRYAGKDSQWVIRGHEVFEKKSNSMESGARALGDVLRAWADQVEAGMITIPQAEAQGVRAVASTDLMEQVRKLNEDKDVSPAAPIVLAGGSAGDRAAVRRGGAWPGASDEGFDQCLFGSSPVCWDAVSPGRQGRGTDGRSPEHRCPW